MLSYDYENFNKKGLKKIIDRFTSEGLPVADVKGNNKQIRDNGFPTKTAEIDFESGQILIAKAKLDGGIYQWKLNGKILAIKNYIQLDAAIKEVVAFVKANEPNYQKQKEKQLARQKVAVPTIKAVNTTTEEQTAAFQTSLDDLTGQNEALNNQITEAKTLTGTRQSDLDALAAQIAAENERTKTLEDQLDKAKQGIFEGAGDDETDTSVCPECGATMQEGENGMECPACGRKTDMQEMVMEAATKFALPGFSQWNTYAGGTSTAAGKSSYDIRAEGGRGPNGLVQFTVDPISNSAGRHQGYSLKAAGLPGMSGLWCWIGPDAKPNSNGNARLLAKPQDAVRIAQQIYEERVVNNKEVA